MKLLRRVPSFVKRHKVWTMLIIFALLIIGFMIRPKAPATIPTQKVKIGDISQTVSATGTVNAKRFVNLNFQIPGLVTYVGAKKGDFVNAYQTIATIDVREAQKNLKSALLTYSEQRNNFEQKKQDTGASRPEDAINDTIKRILQNNQYDLDKAVVSVELTDLAKQKSVLTTPIAGIVSRADIETAGVVANATTTYTVVDPDSVVFNMDVDEADVAKLSVGQNVTIKLDAYPNQDINLTVSNIDFVSHNTSTGGTAYTVEAVLPSNSDYRYRVGMSGDGEILIVKHTGVVVVPLVAVFNDNHVYVKTQKGYEDKRVNLGIQNDTDAEIMTGIKPGDMVVLQPDQVNKQKQTRKIF